MSTRGYQSKPPSGAPASRMSARKYAEKEEVRKKRVAANNKAKEQRRRVQASWVTDPEKVKARATAQGKKEGWAKTPRPMPKPASKGKAGDKAPNAGKATSPRPKAKPKATTQTPSRKQTSNANKANNPKAKEPVSARGAKFDAARKKGRDRFEHDGKWYHTRLAGESEAAWKKTLAANKKTPPKPTRKPTKSAAEKPKKATKPPTNILNKAPPKNPPKRKPRGKVSSRGKLILTPRRKPRDMRPER